MGKRQKKKQTDSDLVAVGKYYLPASVAEMYRALRQTIESEILAWARGKFQRVEYEETEEDEWVIAYNDGEVVWRYRLDPSGVADAQKAHDKQTMSDYLEKYLKP